MAEELQAALETAFGKPYLNDFAALGIATIRQARNAIQKTFSKSEQPADCAFRCDSDIKLHLPMKVAEYTDFLTSKEHSLNAAAVIFDGQPDRINVPPSFFTAPIGYHGRASSVVVSGTPIRRPRNVARDRQTGKLYYEPSKALDYEIELVRDAGSSPDYAELNGLPVRCRVSSCANPIRWESQCLLQKRRTVSLALFF